MRLFDFLFAALITIVVGLLPLILSGMIPNGLQRWAAAIFALLGILILSGYLGAEAPTPYAVGLAGGFLIATVKLTTGIRLL